MKIADRVEIPRFMGDWYVLAHIPAPAEKEAWDPERRETVIGRSARDYVWVMARTPEVTESDWARLTGIVKDAGYDLAKLRKVPQRWGDRPDGSLAERYSAAR